MLQCHSEMSHVLQTQTFAYKDGLVLEKYRVQSQAEQLQQEGKRVTDVAKVCLNCVCLVLCVCVCVCVCALIVLKPRKWTCLS